MLQGVPKVATSGNQPGCQTCSRRLGVGVPMKGPPPAASTSTSSTRRGLYYSVAVTLCIMLHPMLAQGFLHPIAPYSSSPPHGRGHSYENTKPFQRHTVVVHSAFVRASKPLAAGNFTVVFMRHGQSDFNKYEVFTGWCDVDLNPVVSGRQISEFVMV